MVGKGWYLGTVAGVVLITRLQSMASSLGMPACSSRATTKALGGALIAVRRISVPVE